MLVLGPNSRLVAKHKDRAQSHVAAQPSTPPPIQPDTLLEDITADVAESPEVQSTSVEVPITPKPKRRRDNKTQVRNHSLGNH